MNGAILVAATGLDAANWAERFRVLAPEQDIRLWPDAGDLSQITYACGWKPEPGTLAALPNLKVLFSLGAGVDSLIADPALPPEVPLVRVVDSDLTIRMSEYVVLNVLAHHRRLPRALLDQRARQWNQHDQPSAPAVRVGIMGMGELGRDAAHKLVMMGFTVLGWSRSAKQLTGIRYFTGEAELPAFLAETDILVVLLPLTPETRGIIDAELLRQLPRDGALGGPVLINAGRGGLQNEPEVIAALTDGTLLAASLDVFETEPLSESSPLWDLPNVLLTPHMAADPDPDRLFRAILEQIRRFETGEPLQNVVDRSVGY
ncbi:glyoxylate/hydroxypyruvate reductase A [Ancylobacter sp. 6x-1]|uniref:Glyoxylate/hydroxypyruvate reductase A n=1 Tax=Ancylobacter crimeensis TaxID=2579147 RepID=A0ABT0DAX2_9HYPH|nr:glyoxylate/hydroxypyruvate reductase A [Ancylobacter crimeensis]MCK0197111.1 glyoxylate/hydroxypyruvate reductase A [Ancylobacter crimeensis]